MASAASRSDDCEPDQRKNRLHWFCEQMTKRTGRTIEESRLRLASPEMNLVGSSGTSSVHYIARMCGVTIEERAVLQQWMEYIANYVDRSNSKIETIKILNKIDSHLSSRCFLNGNSISLADLYVYASLNPILQQLTFQEKENIQHVSRWCRNIQNLVENPIWAPRIIFSRNPLYKSL